MSTGAAPQRGPSGAHPPRPVGTPFVDMDRTTWSRLRQNTPLTLTEDEVGRVRGLGEVLDLDEVEEVYLPLSRLLNLYVGGGAPAARRHLDVPR